MIIKDIFENVNDWLKFAEAKNGVIIALNSAIIFGILKLYPSLKIDNSYIEYYITYIILFLTISIIIALLSFIPRFYYPFIKIDKISESDNLLYFGDIAKYNEIEYSRKILEKIPDTEKTSFDVYYINQIVNNAKITYIKYKQFEISVWFTISVFLTPFGTAILFLYKKKKVELR